MRIGVIVSYNTKSRCGKLMDEKRVYYFTESDFYNSYDFMKNDTVTFKSEVVNNASGNFYIARLIRKYEPKPIIDITSQNTLMIKSKKRY